MRAILYSLLRPLLAVEALASGLNMSDPSLLSQRALAARDLDCPRRSAEPWHQFESQVNHLIACALDPKCYLPQPIYRMLVGIADEIAYRDVSEYKELSAECPAGFAVALAIVALHGQLEGRADAISVDRMLKMISSHALAATMTSDPTFGASKPLLLLRAMQLQARRRLISILNMPAEGREPLQGHQMHILGDNVSSHEPSLPSDLCVVLKHDSNADLAMLRNTIETLATGRVLGPGVHFAVHFGSCDGAWQDTSRPEGWYLSWLQRRFGMELHCGGNPLPPCRALSAVLLVLDTTWHLLPYWPHVIAAHLRSAAELLRRSAKIMAVSLSEKVLHGAAGVEGSGRRVLWALSSKSTQTDNLANLVLSAPSLVGQWNLSAAADFMSGLDTFYAAPPSASAAGNIVDVAKLVRPCVEGLDAVCVPAKWWPSGIDTTKGDAWLVRPNISHWQTKVHVGSIALSRGVFQRSGDEPYDATPHILNGRGVPDCYTCHMLPPGDDFTLYLATLDIIGPCRELFSNLLLDVLESLQLSSFQGPHVTLVEPMIANAVWQRYDQSAAAKLQASGKATSIYSFWNEETACGLRHGSATRFGQLFDWPALVRWLREVRGIHGGISWPEFTARTAKSLDAVAMLSIHPKDKKAGREEVPCTDDDSPSRMRFFDVDFSVARRRCVRSTAQKHAGGFELRFMDLPRLAAAAREAVARARAQGRRWAALGLYLYWLEGPERARLHPGRYGQLSSHGAYASLWQGLRFAAGVRRRAAAVVAGLGFLGKRFLAAHWRLGDWFLGPHPRKLEQAELAQAPRFAAVLRRHLARHDISNLFLMTNVVLAGRQMQALSAELPGVLITQAPVLRGDRHNLRQLCIEMAIASSANFFIAFGDGIVQGHASMPSLLVLQMRLHAGGWPMESNAFAFVQEEFQDALGL